MNKIKAYFSDKAFFKTVIAIALPMVIQNGITNLVGVLDNVMVGRVSDEATSGVAIANQFMLVFYLVTFGAVSAAGIFTAQYHGKADTENVRATFRIKLMICTAAAVVGIVIFRFFGDSFINLFLTESDTDIDIASTFEQGHKYLTVMLWGILPYSVSQAYASTLRETERTIPPMVSSLVAVTVNLFLNYVLIFGKLGAPALGVEGAAVATVISRYAELLILVVWTHTGAKKSAFAVGAYRSLKVPAQLVKKVAVMGLPLMINEGLWSLAVTMRNQCYSTRGLESVTAMSISSTFTNLFNVVFLSLGSAVAVMIGNLLGAGKIEEAKSTDKKLITFSLLISVAVGAVFAALSPLFPKFYNTSESVAALSVYMMVVYAVMMPFSAYANAAYFTLRSGGKVFITVVFDSVFMWAFVMPLAFVLSRFTGIGIHGLFLICQGTDVLKAVLGYILLRRGTWAVRLVKE